MADDVKAAQRAELDRDGKGLRVAIVCARFNDHITQRLLDGVYRGLRACAVDDADVTLEWVPGSFELPLAAKLAAGTGRFAGVACLGAVIRGETDHYDYVCAETARGVQQVSLETGVPCAFGVITCDTMEQALARAGGEKRDTGEGAAQTVMHMALLARTLA